MAGFRDRAGVVQLRASGYRDVKLIVDVDGHPDQPLKAHLALVLDRLTQTSATPGQEAWQLALREGRAMTRYNLVGRVPLAYERREDGSVVLRTFNFLTRAFVTDARYCRATLRNDIGGVRELTPAEYGAPVEAIRAG